MSQVQLHYDRKTTRFFSTNEQYRVRKDPRKYRETFKRFEKHFFEREKCARNVP